VSVEPTVTSDEAHQALVALLSKRVHGLPAWRVRVLAGFGPPFDDQGFARAFATAGRELGTASIALTADERAELAREGVTWAAEQRSADELARIAMLVEAGRRLPPARLEGVVQDCYRQGEIRERVAVLRALPFLPPHDRFLALAIEACRSSVQPVFEAIAAENPFPADRFLEPSFNQMVLKAVFTGMPLDRIIGLDARRTPELARMADAYASERRAAGRPIPADLVRLRIAKEGG